MWTTPLYLFMFLVALSGCTGHPPLSEQSNQLLHEWSGAAEPQRSWALEIADRRAQQVLDEYHANRLLIGKVLHYDLDEYAKSVFERRMHENKAEFSVTYQHHPLDSALRGHPRHFTIYVSGRDGSARVAYGR